MLDHLNFFCYLNGNKIRSQVGFAWERNSLTWSNYWILSILFLLLGSSSQVMRNFNRICLEAEEELKAKVANSLEEFDAKGYLDCNSYGKIELCHTLVLLVLTYLFFQQLLIWTHVESSSSVVTCPYFCSFFFFEPYFCFVLLALLFVSLKFCWTANILRIVQCLYLYNSSMCKSSHVSRVIAGPTYPS